jgi:hypothetical protein
VQFAQAVFRRHFLLSRVKNGGCACACACSLHLRLGGNHSAFDHLHYDLPPAQTSAPLRTGSIVAGRTAGKVLRLAVEIRTEVVLQVIDVLRSIKLTQIETVYGRILALRLK